MKPWPNGASAVLTLLAALVLHVAHLPAAAPEWMAWLRPHWVLLVVIFWTLARPRLLGLPLVWLLGFAVDVLNTDPLGLNGGAFAIATFAVTRFRHQLHTHSVLNQAVAVALLVFAVELLSQFVRNLASGQPYSSTLWGLALASALYWPFIHLLLRRKRNQYFAQ